MSDDHPFVGGFEIDPMQPTICQICEKRHETPKALDAVADIVLAYRPKAKSKPARRRKRRANKLVKAK